MDGETSPTEESSSDTIMEEEKGEKDEEATNKPCKEEGKEESKETKLSRLSIMEVHGTMEGYSL